MAGALAPIRFPATPAGTPISAHSPPLGAFDPQHLQSHQGLPHAG